MPFQNANINSTSFSGTTIDATGGSIFSGSTPLSNVFISKPRKLIIADHSIPGLVQGSGATTETIIEQWSYPSGFFKAGDTLECWWSPFYSSSTGTNTKIARIRIGTAGTTSDFACHSQTTASANAHLLNNSMMRFSDNSTIESGNVFNVSFWTAANFAYLSSSTLNLSGSTTYVSLTVQRTVLAADTVAFRYFDLYHNKL